MGGILWPFVANAWRECLLLVLQYDKVLSMILESEHSKVAQRINTMVQHRAEQCVRTLVSSIFYTYRYL